MFSPGLDANDLAMVNSVLYSETVRTDSTPPQSIIQRASSEAGVPGAPSNTPVPTPSVSPVAKIKPLKKSENTSTDSSSSSSESSDDPVDSSELICLLGHGTFYSYLLRISRFRFKLRISRFRFRLRISRFRLRLRISRFRLRLRISSFRIISKMFNILCNFFKQKRFV